jgi:type IV pilus assembly protein PilC
VVSPKRRTVYLEVEIPPTDTAEKAGSAPSIRLTALELLVFTRQLAAMYGAGTPLLPALESLSRQAEGLPLALLLTNLSWRVRQGWSLADAFDAHMDAFPSVYRGLIREGESSGTLQSCLHRNADLLERQIQVRHRCALALSYPVMVAVTGLASGLAAMLVLAPLLTDTFGDPTQPLPFATRILLIVSKALDSRPTIAVFMLLLVLTAYQACRRLATPEGRRFRDETLLRIPILGGLAQKATLVRICQTLGTSCSSGLALTQSLEHCAEVAGNEVFRTDLLEARAALIRGVPLERYFSKRRDLYTPAFAAVVACGVEAGNLDYSLACLERLLSYDLEAGIESGLALVQPLLLGGTGLLIGFLCMAIMLPIYHLQ